MIPLCVPSEAGATESDDDASNDDEDGRVRALAHSLLQLSPEELGLSPKKADIGSGSAAGTAHDNADAGCTALAPLFTSLEGAPSAPSHHQRQLKAALCDPIDSSAAFGVFARLLQQRAQAARQAAAEERQGAQELSKLEASFELSAKLKRLKSQLVQEKAESEVAIAQRERVIRGLRSQLDAARSAMAGPDVDAIEREATIYPTRMD